MDLMSLISLDFLKGKPKKKDSKLRSALEVALDVLIGCTIATIMNYTILPLYIDVIQSGEIFGMLFNARYLLLLMGICAFHNGWVYNDCCLIYSCCYEQIAFFRTTCVYEFWV